MNIEEALKTSIEYETRVREVYVEAMEVATDPIGKRVFKLMADEEHGHVKYLEAKLKTFLEGGQLSGGDLDTALPAPAKIQDEVAKLEKRVDAGADTGELAALEKALEVEKETSAFYRKVVDELPAEGREFFQRFVEIEEGHVGLVQAEIDSVKGLGYWFDMPEFELENA
jgi:rubrerythrin